MDLLDYGLYKDMNFEIQIRTILQHAWAEFEHDNNYKFQGILPEQIKRRLNLIAGNLELLDWTFESISEEIDQYRKEIEKKSESGDLLATEITSLALRFYLLKKFEKLLNNELTDFDGGGDFKAISELSNVGIKTLKQLDNKIPEDFVEVVIEANLDASILGLLRYIMIISDTDKYFSDAWDGEWKHLDKGALDLFKHYSISEKSLREHLRRRKPLHNN